jgi:hypothetical protein
MHLHITFKRLGLILAGSTFALAAAAQWQWIDKDGRKVFSDRAPPSDIAQKDILKQPGRGRASVVPAEVPEAGPTAATTATTAAAAVKAAAPKVSGKDADLQAKKKKLEEEEAAKKKLDEEKATQANAENCTRVKKSLASLKSGVRLSTTNNQGEREPMDDAARNAETKRLQAIIESDCRAS